MKLLRLISVRFIAFNMLVFSSNLLAAQKTGPAKPSESAEQPPEVPEVQESPDDVSEGSKGYHPEGRRVGTPTDVDRDLDYSFPKLDYVLPRIIPQTWFKYKEDLYEKYGVKLGGSFHPLSGPRAGGGLRTLADSGLNALCGQNCQRYEL